jgi:hypothetical protein
MIVRMLFGLTELDERGVQELGTMWAALLVPAQSDEAVKTMWDEVLATGVS